MDIQLDKDTIGKIGEHMTFAQLLKLGYEVYLAVSKSQKHWDIIAVVNNSFKRIQVKTTFLQNESKNNSTNIGIVGYDILVIVVIDDDKTDFLILTKNEVKIEKSSNKKLSVSQFINDKYSIKTSLISHREQWGKIDRR